MFSESKIIFDVVMFVVTVMALFLHKNDKRGRITSTTVIYAFIFVYSYSSFYSTDITPGKYAAILTLLLFILFFLSAINANISDQHKYEDELSFYEQIRYRIIANIFIDYQTCIVLYVVITVCLASLGGTFTSLNYILVFSFWIANIYLIIARNFYYLSFTDTLWKIGFLQEVLLECADLGINLYNEDKNESVDIACLELLSFVIFVEDQTFLVREKPYLQNSYYLHKACEKFKIFIQSIKSKENRSLSEKRKKYVTTMKGYWRGYSTIPQQLVRSQAIGNWSYSKTFTRKLFIERSYTKYVIKAYKNLRVKNLVKSNPPKSRTRDFKNKVSQHIDDVIKAKFLILYYINILKSPKDIDELITKFSVITRLGEVTLGQKYISFLEWDKRPETETRIKEIIYQLYRFENSLGPS